MYGSKDDGTIEPSFEYLRNMTLEENRKSMKLPSHCTVHHRLRVVVTTIKEFDLTSTSIPSTSKVKLDLSASTPSANSFSFYKNLSRSCKQLL